ncbi:MAG: NUDIX domain-containing protein [Candidatus Binatia bacterium]
MSSPRNPFPTVDTIIELDTGGIVLIRRKNPPPGWALPGGFIDYGESAEAAAIREAREETSLDVQLVELFHVYSDPRRDPRKHTMAVVFIATASGTPCGGDDAAEAAVHYEHDLPSPLAFDHAQILRDYFTYKRTGRRPRYS